MHVCMTFEILSEHIKLKKIIKSNRRKNEYHCVSINVITTMIRILRLFFLNILMNSQHLFENTHSLPSKCFIYNQFRRSIY